MDKLISLIKIDFNTTFGLSSLAYSFKTKKNRWQYFLFGFAALSLLPTYFLLLKALGNIYDVYGQIGQRSYFLQTGIFLSQALVLVLGILYVMSKYYFSNDLELLVPLPIKASQILGSKFVILMLSEYITTLPIILPFIFIYGTKGGEGLLYWIYSLILVLTIPIIPLIISSILVMIFMKYTNIKGKKDTLRIIGALFFIVLILFMQLFMQKIAQNALGGGEEFYLNLVKDSNLLVKKLGIVFPPSMWASLALANYSHLNGLLYLLLFLTVSFLGYLLMIKLSEGLFFDGLIGNMEVTAGKGRVKRKSQGIIKVKEGKAYMAIAKKEIIMLFKTPVYVLNSIAGAIIIPLLILMTVLMGDESLNMVLELLKVNSQYFVLGSIAMIVIQAAMNPVGATSFSREGKSFWIHRVLPIKVENQIIGRILASLVPQIISVLALLITFAFLLKISIINIILISLLGLLGSIPMIQIGMIIDIIRPLLIWDNPQKAMKQNLNVLISMGLGTLYSGGLIFLVFNLMKKLHANSIYIILGLIFIISTMIFYMVLRKLIIKQFAELE